jgi:tripartite-type tricarboxylate transporter receptor subunit TctC
MSLLAARVLRFAALAIAAMPLAAPAESGTAWPTRPVTIVSPYNPGGTNDIQTRLLADAFQRIFGQPFIVKNVNGAAGAIGGEQVMNARPDGYTLLLTNIGAMIVQPVVMSPPPYDPVKNFTPIAKVSDTYAFVGVSADMPVKNVGELVALAKREPGKLNYTSAGSGSFGNFIGEYFKLLTGTDIAHIPARSSSSAITEIKAGRVQVMFDPLVLPQSTDGRVKVLAVVSKTRLPIAPQVPTVSEAGGPELGVTAWYGLFGPPNMPRDIVAKLEAGLHKAMADPDMKSKMVAAGLAPNVQTGEAFRNVIESDLKVFTEVKVRAKLSVE